MNIIELLLYLKSDIYRRMQLATLGFTYMDYFLSQIGLSSSLFPFPFSVVFLQHMFGGYLSFEGIN